MKPIYAPLRDARMYLRVPDLDEQINVRKYEYVQRFEHPATGEK